MGRRGVEGSSHHHALHVVSAGISRATGFTNAPDKGIALYALYALTAVILRVCVCVCVCERSRTSVLLLFVTSVFDMSHSGSHFYIGVGPSSIFPGKERKERGREGEREREGSRQGRQGGRRYRVARLGSNGSEERRGRAIAPQSISSTEGGERGSRREVFRDNIYVPVV